MHHTLSAGSVCLGKVDILRQLQGTRGTTKATIFQGRSNTKRLSGQGDPALHRHTMWNNCSLTIV